GLTADDHVDSITEVALMEDLFARLEVLLRDAHRRVEFQLHQLCRQQQIERPRRSDLEAAAPARQLHQVDGSPDPPGEESRKLDAENLRHRRAVAERTHLAKLVKRESLLGAAANVGEDIFRGKL